MSNPVSPSNRPKPNPAQTTRQQLDDLDALLQRMLDLPVNPHEDSIPEPLVEQPMQPPATRPAGPRIYPQSYMVVENTTPDLRNLSQEPDAESPDDSSHESSLEPPFGRSSPLAPRLLPAMPAESQPPISHEASEDVEDSPEPEEWVPLRSSWQPSAQTWKPLAQNWAHSQSSPDEAPPEPPPLPNTNSATPSVTPAYLDMPHSHHEQRQERPAPVMPEMRSGGGPSIVTRTAPEDDFVNPNQPAHDPYAQMPDPPMFGPLPVTPEPGQHSAQPDPPLPPLPYRAPLLLKPVVWFNALFDLLLWPTGPLGWWLKQPSGRGVLGVLGILCLLGAIALAVADGIGWTE